MNLLLKYHWWYIYCGLLIIGVLLFSCKQEGLVDPKFCGKEPTVFDRDGDNISDDVEKNSVNKAKHNFNINDCDNDPSLAKDDYCNTGTITGSIKLPLVLGQGYQSSFPSVPTDVSWGTLTLINCVENSGRALDKVNFGEMFNVIALSSENGGDVSPILCHFNGLEVDVLYENSLAPGTPVNLEFFPGDHDTVKTKQYMKHFLAECKEKNSKVIVIFVALAPLGITASDLGVAASLLQDRMGNETYFTVRLSKP
ncbi:MAG: hypothetical protein FVQ77_02635 [Cytophagales bacterium]|nr:hypothetical protein [Cytophagales bacterium]